MENAKKKKLKQILQDKYTPLTTDFYLKIINT